jgi:hypothetical protein
MKTTTFDAVTRHASAVSRRDSFRSAGAAALAGALAATAAGASKGKGKKSKDRCKRQRGQCLAFVEEFCQPKAEPQSCEAGLAPCCEDFARCDAGQGIECIVQAIFAG